MDDSDASTKTSSEEISQLLIDINSGADTEKLFLLLYKELKQYARSQLAREQDGQTLTPTALVHDAYLRLMGNRDLEWDSRGHFFSSAARAMRRILIEKAREKSTAKRGHGIDKVALTTIPDLGDQNSEQLLDLDKALLRLEGLDQEMTQVVMLRFFAGLTVEETAHALNTSTRTVNRYWTAARAWLIRELKDGAMD